MKRGEPFAKTKIQFVMINEGLGGLIYWVTAIRYMIEKHSHIEGYIVCPDYFIELGRHWFKDLEPRFEVVDDLVPGIAAAMPQTARTPNATGFSLLECGFMIYANCPVPHDQYKMPKIIGNEVSLDKFLLPRDYVAVVAGGTAPTRTISAEAVNGISVYLLSKGITPVYLGSKDMYNGKYRTFNSDGINWGNGIDLRGRTGTLEAACILANARVVIGIDSGLCNLAFCSRVPVVMGMTVASPKNRTPYRDADVITEFVVPKLDCIFCQEKIRLLDGYSSKKCIYDDYKCIEMLNSAAFINKLEGIL